MTTTTLKITAIILIVFIVAAWLAYKALCRMAKIADEASELIDDDTHLGI